MKTLIVALNSKFIHASLAPWYLKASCQDDLHDVKVLEYTINDNLEHILSCIYNERPDNLAFSCYIWNMDKVFKLCKNMKGLRPDVQIILGGPEVSYDGEEVLQNNDFIDFVISGEGENVFKALLNRINGQNVDIDSICGLSYRVDGKVISNKGFDIVENLDDIKNPYTQEMINATSGKIMYFEASRGCPFSCSYCLSSTTKGVRYLSIEKVKDRLILLVDAGYHQIKFVDRTFNCNKRRAREIFEFIISKFGANKSINFHFEVAADLFDDDLISLLRTAPKGLIQLEIGIQTLNTQTLYEVHRVSDIDNLIGNVQSLIKPRNIHIHVDLIAGLPYDGFMSFVESFNKVYSLMADNLQLGFLKLLKGSRIRQEAQKHDYIYRDYMPYEVLKNKYMSYDELQSLKGIDELMDKYYNSKRFVITLDYLINRYYKSPFDFFRDYLEYYINNGWIGRSISSRDSYTVLKGYCDSKAEMDRNVLNELLKYDYLASDNSVNLPQGIERQMDSGFIHKCHDFLRQEENIDIYLPQFKGIPVKNIMKRVHFETFYFDVLSMEIRSESIVVLFDYSEKDKVTDRFKAYKVDFEV